MNAKTLHLADNHNDSLTCCQPPSDDNLNPAHYVEWVINSGVSKELTKASVVSIDDRKGIAGLLNWKSYTGKPGWYIKGVDPATGQRRNFGQFKPDEPIPGKDGKSQKYLSFPKGNESEAIFLPADFLSWIEVSERTGIKPTGSDFDSTRCDLGFWQWVVGHPEISIFITEGAKKAACLLSHGYAAIALTGVWNGQRDKKTLAPSLAPFIVPGRSVTMAFDADVVVKPEVQAVRQRSLEGFPP